MRENRVTTKEYGTLPFDSPLLVSVPTTLGYPQQKLHILAAQAFMKMSAAIEADLGFPLTCASGWRPHRWTSWNSYVAFITKKYGSVKEGRKWMAFSSPHETGLAFDIGCGGLEPNRATIKKQLKTPLYKWLDKNEYLYGFTDYSPEPWHKEYHIPLADYKAGKELGLPLQNTIYTLPLIIQNDVCEDNTCMEAPLDPRLTTNLIR